MSAQIFQNDDDAYRAWIAANPAGLVVNSERVPVPHYLILHKATCKTISSTEIKNYTTTGYVKICSNSIDDLNDWCRRETGGTVTPCGTCQPLSGSNKGGVA